MSRLLDLRRSIFGLFLSNREVVKHTTLNLPVSYITPVDRCWMAGIFAAMEVGAV